jgi:hypothetical protein
MACHPTAVPSLRPIAFLRVISGLNEGMILMLRFSR